MQSSYIHIVHCARCVSFQSPCLFILIENAHTAPGGEQQSPGNSALSDLLLYLRNNQLSVVPESLGRPHEKNILLFEKWETTCNEVNSDNFENAAALVSTADCAKKIKDITKGMILLRQFTDGVKTNSTLLQG